MLGAPKVYLSVLISLGSTSRVLPYREPVSLKCQLFRFFLIPSPPLNAEWRPITAEWKGCLRKYVQIMALPRISCDFFTPRFSFEKDQDIRSAYCKF